MKKLVQEKNQARELVPYKDREGPSVYSQPLRSDSYIRDQRAKNVLGHRKSVAQEASIGDDQLASPSLTQLRLAEEWEYGAEDVDPEKDTELAALWQALLEKIFSNEADASELLNVLKKLTPKDADILLKVGGRRDFSGSDFYENNVRRMQEAGILERVSWNVFYRYSSILLILYSFLGFFSLIIYQVRISYLISGFFRGGPDEYVNSTASMPYIFLAIVSVFCAIFFFGRARRYTLTRLGRELWAQGRKYRK